MHFLVFARTPDLRKVEKQPKTILPYFAIFCRLLAIEILPADGKMGSKIILPPTLIPGHCGTDQTICNQMSDTTTSPLIWFVHSGYIIPSHSIYVVHSVFPPVQSRQTVSSYDALPLPYSCQSPRLDVIITLFQVRVGSLHDRARLRIQQWSSRLQFNSRYDAVWSVMTLRNLIFVPREATSCV